MAAAAASHTPQLIAVVQGESLETAVDAENADEKGVVAVEVRRVG